MFGMSFMEILMIAVIAILFLGPDKLPQAMVKVAKFFNSFKGSINEAKATFEQEIKLDELREETQKYKDKLDSGTEEIRKKLTFEELEELKNDTTADIQSALNEIKGSNSLYNTNSDAMPKSTKDLKDSKEDDKKESNA